MKNQSAVIFDLDGTLIDSLSGIARALNSICAESGWPLHTEQAVRTMVGDGVLNLIRRALPNSPKTPKDIEKAVQRYQTVYETVWPSLSKPFPSILKLLTALSAHNIPMSILSNKTHEVTRRMVDTLLPDVHFVEVLGQRPGQPIKPDPTCALQLCRAMKKQPEETLLVGDSGVDIETALNADMMGIGVSWGMRDTEELIRSGAKWIVSSPMEILDIVKYLE